MVEDVLLWGSFYTVLNPICEAMLGFPNRHLIYQIKKSTFDGYSHTFTLGYEDGCSQDL